MRIAHAEVLLFIPVSGLHGLNLRTVDKYLHADARSSTSALLVKYPIVVDVHITASSQERSASHTCQVTLSGLPMSVPGYRL